MKYFDKKIVRFHNFLFENFFCNIVTKNYSSLKFILMFNYPNNDLISAYGMSIPSVLANPFDENGDQPPTIGMESRKLRVLLLKLMEYR